MLAISSILTPRVQLWAMYCEVIKPTGKSLPEGSNFKAVVINISGVPTGNGVGGVGQSELERALSFLVDQRDSYDTGTEFRLYLGNLLGFKRPLNDREFADALNELESEWDPEYDRYLDKRAVDHIVEQSVKGRDVIGIGTKILGLLPEQADVDFVEPLSNFLLINVAVVATDEVAFRRKCEAARRKPENNHQSDEEIQTKVRKDRLKRKNGDERKYPKAYHGFVYSAERVLESSHLVVDNSKELNPYERLMLVYRLLETIVAEYPQTAPFLTKYLSE